MDLAALAALSRPETMHRPTDHDLLAREARALADLGLQVRDIAQALGLAEAEVQELL